MVKCHTWWLIPLSDLVGDYNPSYTWINPTYPANRTGFYNPQSGMSHQVEIIVAQTAVLGEDNAIFIHFYHPQVITIFMGINNNHKKWGGLPSGYLT